MPPHSPLFTETCANPIGAGNVVKGTWKKGSPPNGFRKYALRHSTQGGSLAAILDDDVCLLCVSVRLNDPHSWPTVGRVEVVPVPPEHL